MTTPAENNGQPTVFILDDDDAVRDLLQILMESAGFTVEAFASPLDFLGSSAPGRPGCLLIDVRMPEMSGIEVQESLAAGNRQLPVIVMTGHADVPLAVRAMKAGAVDFIEKPFDDTVIIETVRRALELRPAANPEIAQRLAS